MDMEYSLENVKQAFQQLGPKQLSFQAGTLDPLPGEPVNQTDISRPCLRTGKAKKTHCGRDAGRLGGRNTKSSKTSKQQWQEDTTMGHSWPEMSQLLAPALCPSPSHRHSVPVNTGRSWQEEVL